MSEDLVPDGAALVQAAAQVGAALRARGWMLATAESCTGGLVGAAITAIAGSSAWFERGFVTYSNAAKTALLGVPAQLIAAHGAVSREVALAMAAGALRAAPVQIAVSITGIAGPDGGSADKPVGTVWFGLACAGREPQARHALFAGDRAAVRQQAALLALRWVSEAAQAGD